MLPGLSILYKHETSRKRGNRQDLEYVWNHQRAWGDTRKKVPTAGSLPSSSSPSGGTHLQPAGQKNHHRRTGVILLEDRAESVLEAVGPIFRALDHRVAKRVETFARPKPCSKKEDFDLVVADLTLADGANGGRAE